MDKFIDGLLSFTLIIGCVALIFALAASVYLLGGGVFNWWPLIMGDG